MTIARGRLWRAERLKGSEAVGLVLEREGLPRELEELGDFRIEVPLREWRRVVRTLRGDRKLLGGLLLDFARQKDRLSAVIASDRLYLGLVEIIGEATLALHRIRRPRARAGRGRRLSRSRGAATHPRLHLLVAGGSLEDFT